MWRWGLLSKVSLVAIFPKSLFCFLLGVSHSLTKASKTVVAFLDLLFYLWHYIIAHITKQSWAPYNGQKKNNTIINVNLYYTLTHQKTLAREYGYKYGYFLMYAGEEENHEGQRRRNIRNRTCAVIFGRGWGTFNCFLYLLTYESFYYDLSIGSNKRD